jgi:hypothetical protein
MVWLALARQLQGLSAKAPDGFRLAGIWVLLAPLKKTL